MIVTILLLAQYAGSFDVSDTSRIDARVTDPPPIVPSGNGQGKEIVGADVATTPAARLHVAERQWDYSLGYAPTITAADVELGFVPQTVQAAAAAVGWHDRSWRVTVSEAASLGFYNSALFYAQPNLQPAAAANTAGTGTGGAAGAAGATGTGGTAGTAGAAGAMGTMGTGGTGAVGTTTTNVQGVPQQPQNALVGSSSTAANVGTALSRRTSFTALAGYSTSGGLNTESKLIFPQQYGASAGASIGYIASRLDGVGLNVSAQETTTSGLCPPTPGGALAPTPQFCNVFTPFGQVGLQWRHSLSRTATLSMGAGVSASIAQTLTVREVVIEPSALVAFSEILSAHPLSSFSLSAGITPTVDALTGLPITRAQVNAGFIEQLAQRASIGFTAGYVQSVPVPVQDPYALVNVTAQLDAQFHVSPELDVGMGVQTLWQSQTGYANLTSNIGYVNVTARMRTVHF